MASTVVDELVTLLSLEGDSQNEGEAKKFSKALGSIQDKAKLAGAALLAANAAITAWTLKTAAAVDESGKFAESLGISFEKLQEFEFAAERVGGSVGELRGDIETLQTQFGGFEDADQTLERLARQFDGLSNAQAQMLGKSFGLSETTVRLLQRGSEGLASLRAEARALGGIIPEEAAKDAAAFQDQLTNIKFALGGMAQTATVAVLPALTEVAEGFTRFVVENKAAIQEFTKDFISGFMDGFGRFQSLLVSVGSTMSQFIGPLGDFIDKFEMADVVSSAVFASLAAIGVVLLPIAIKIAAIGAAVAALIIVFDDFITFLEGGESVIGDFFAAFEDRFPAIAALVKQLTELFKSGLFIQLKFLRAQLEAVVKLISMAFEGWGMILDLANKGLEKLGFGGEVVQSIAQSVAPEVAAGVAPGSMAPVSSSTMNQSTQTINTGDTTFNISGANSPAATAQAIADRGGFRNTQQTITPGQLAPVVG